jgi:hypothetical protein
MAQQGQDNTHLYTRNPPKPAKTKAARYIDGTSISSSARWHSQQPNKYIVTRFQQFRTTRKQNIQNQRNFTRKPFTLIYLPARKESGKLGCTSNREKGTTVPERGTGLCQIATTTQASRPTRIKQHPTIRQSIEQTFQPAKKIIKILGFLSEKGQRQQWHKREAKGTVPAQPQLKRNHHNPRHAQTNKQITHNHKEKDQVRVYQNRK